MEKVEGFWDFSRPPLRLALLDDKSFWDLSLKLGLAIWAPSLATELWSEAALKRRKSLGPLLKWALGRGRLSLTNEMRREIMEGLSGPPQDEEGFRLTGLKAMAMALGECPEEVMERNKDRFFLSEGLKVDGTLSGRVWIWIKKTLVEVAPLWKDCFK
jgi:hypothetical protein